jgi:hypothetical protein
MTTYEITDAGGQVFGGRLVSETPEQRIWKLEQDTKRTNEVLARLLQAYEGNGRPGMRDELRDIRREMQTLNALAGSVQALEKTAVQDGRMSAAEGRITALENKDTKEEGVHIGRRAVIGIVITVLGILGGILTVMMQLSSLSSRFVGGGG